MLLILIFSLSFQVSVSLNKVEIKGPEYIKRGEHIILNCSSDDVPVGPSAEVLVNDETYTNIRAQDKECFSGISHAKCLPEECYCSEDGKWYIIQLPANDDMMNVKISCTMKFTSERVSNSTIVKKIDVYGPYIKVHDELPLEVGRTTKLTCSVTTSLQDISIMWHCLNKSADMENPLPSMYLSVLSLTTVADYEGSECSCTVKWKTFLSKSSITITVSYSPSLEVFQKQQCTVSKTSEVVCIVHGDLTMFGFTAWEHFVKRQYIRDLEGDVKGNKSTLILPCSYQNAGEYICTTWNDNLTRRYWSNKSTIIEVQEPPSILSDKTVKISDTISLTVEFVTSLKPFKVEWFKDNTNLTNSSAYNIKMVNANITVDIYSKQIDAPGYISSLYINGYLPGTYKIVVPNVKGHSTRRFIFGHDSGDLKVQIASFRDEDVFTFWNLVLITAGFIFVILTVLITIVVTRKIAFSNVDGSFSVPRLPNAIYYAAPTADTTNTTYDTTESLYIDPIDNETRRSFTEIDRKETDRQSHDNNTDEDIPHYIEII